jgi:hypothetical protein
MIEEKEVLLEIFQTRLNSVLQNDSKLNVLISLQIEYATHPSCITPITLTPPPER